MLTILMMLLLLHSTQKWHTEQKVETLLFVLSSIVLVSLLSVRIGIEK